MHGGPKRHHYVAYLRGEQIETGETKEQVQDKALARLLGVFKHQSGHLYASLTNDGTICTTREYAPGEVEFTYHRGLDRFNGSMLSRCEVDGKAVTVREYHEHYVQMYNNATTGKVESE